MIVEPLRLHFKTTTNILNKILINIPFAHDWIKIVQQSNLKLITLLSLKLITCRGWSVRQHVHRDFARILKSIN